MKRTQTTYLLTIGALFLLALGAGGGWFLASWAASGVWWPLVLVGARPHPAALVAVADGGVVGVVDVPHRPLGADRGQGVEVVGRRR